MLKYVKWDLKWPIQFTSVTLQVYTLDINTIQAFRLCDVNGNRKYYIFDERTISKKVLKE